ncbi:hypothetical protein GCM10022228_19400 [Halomonas cibimaris]|uniref:Sulfurtransferase complex subunit TusC n=1 Tax=Halomonas cibimaris TaxID=657012 RepID=A0ABP7LUH7_9GAMM
MNNTLLVVIRSAPHQGVRLRESLDALLVAAAFGKPVVPLFMGQGILALLPEQSQGAPGQKATLPIIHMLEMYDVETLYLPIDDAAVRGLDDSQLTGNTKQLDPNEVQALFQGAEHILVF